MKLKNVYINAAHHKYLKVESSKADLTIQQLLEHIIERHIEKQYKQRKAKAKAKK